MRRAVFGGCAAGLATGWNVANIGAIPSHLARTYGVGLAVVGLFTTALFVTHLAMQIPGGRAADRFGARRAALVGLAITVAFNGLALVAAEPALALVARALTGIGTGLAFVAGSAYVRESGGSPFAQGLFGGVGLAGGGVALAVVSQLDGWLGWRAPFWTALVVGAGGLAVLLAAPAEQRRVRAERDLDVPAGILRDTRLYRLAVLYAASLGLSLVVGNWVVELLHRNAGVAKGTAGAVGALTLLLGVVTRPLGGWILRERPASTRGAVGASLVAGAAGTALLAVAEPLALAVVGAVLIGLAAGIPFAPAFTGAALARPDAPAAAVGLVNGAASLVAICGAPLLGLTFSLPGDGRIGFAVVAALWLVALALLPSRHDLAVRAV
ncbi:MAG TPA: MFS transporter [Gaiellaceae bacterium]|nr:MFS transporter [Gaiellaceae bacterium]